MELFFQQVLNGAMLGSTYAMVALGLTLVFGILHVPNFAHGHIYMLGAYVTFFLFTLFGCCCSYDCAVAALYQEDVTWYQHRSTGPRSGGGATGGYQC